MDHFQDEWPFIILVLLGRVLNITSAKVKGKAYVLQYFTGDHALKRLLCRVPFLILLLGADSLWANEGEIAKPSDRVEATQGPVGVSQPPVSSKVARMELQSLMDSGLKLLAQELVDKGTFYPFVAMLGHDGEIRLIGAPASLRVDDADAALNSLIKKVKALAQEKRIRAAAFFMDYVATRQDTGFSQAGIRVELNHIHPDALSVFVPYSVTADKKLRLLTPQYKKGKNVVFDPR
jgi:hypothetical protein